MPSRSLKNLRKRDPVFIEASRIVAALQKSGFKAYFVGGCVRDLLLGLQPYDYDIATDAKPDDVKRVFPEAKGFGKPFGVLIVPTPSGEVEVAAFRKDGFYFDHRRPSTVDFAGIVEDANRRDFTINALYYDPSTDEIIDLVDGRADLEKRSLRIIGNAFERFDEDWLRLLRAIRFATRFSFYFDYSTWDALRTLAPMVVGVSAERRTDEIRWMLTGKFPGRALGLLYSSGMWKSLWSAVPFTARRVRKVVHLLREEKNESSIWRAFFVDLHEDIIQSACQNLRLTRKEKRALELKSQ